MKYTTSFSKYKAQTDITPFGVEQAGQVLAYHGSFPQYSVTALTPLACFAGKYGVKNIYIKDESSRFGLNAFKVLGGSYAIGRILADKFGIDVFSLSYRDFEKAQIKDALKDITFITATDGNHGRGVAATAQMLGSKAYVYMPEDTAAERRDNILKTGAYCEITDMNYDDCVRMCARMAEENGWILVQDTAFADYREIPKYIMQGYTTMALEAYRQLNGEKPTHIFVQAGVGSLAAAVTAFYADAYGTDRPKIIVVEADKADCLYQTAVADDDKLHFVTGKLDTIMAGLACGEPSELAWPVLRDYADAFVSMPDCCAARAMKALANPCGEDKAVVSGESGASGFGALLDILDNPENSSLKKELALDENSVILVFSTEGATDRENYDRIVNG